MKNKQGNVYGLKFSYAGQSFKASEIGREFGYRSLQKNFEATNKEEQKKPHQTIQEPIERKERPDTGYQLVPPRRSSISRENDTPRAQNSIGTVADTIVSAADEVVEGLGDLITPSTQGNDLTEAAWQRKLRYTPIERKDEEEEYNLQPDNQSKMQKEEYFIINACYSVTKSYLCKQNNKRSLLGRKQRSRVARSFPNRYQFSYINTVTSLFSIRYILIIILHGKSMMMAVLFRDHVVQDGSFKAMNV